MEFAEVIRRRRMVRQFSQRPIAPDVVERILASALRAPSAGFAQGWAFLALTEPQDRARFWPFVPNQVGHTPETANAPLVVIPLAHKAAYLARYAEPDKGWQDRAESRWPAPYWHIDTAMAGMLMLLCAVDEGLDAFLFWIMPTPAALEAVDAVPNHLDAFRAEFGIPGDYHPIGAIAIGYRAPDLAPQSPQIGQRRRAAQDVIHRGQWRRSPSAVTYRRLGPAEARATAQALKPVYTAVFAEPPYSEPPEMADKFAAWVNDESWQPGFTMIVAYDSGKPIGFSYGYLMSAGEWFRGSPLPGPDEVRAADKYAVMEWAVLPGHRGIGVGKALLRSLLHGRPEPLAVLTVHPEAQARALYARLGWRQIAATPPGPNYMHVMALDLTGDR